jgi:hypothetical protein
MTPAQSHPKADADEISIDAANAQAAGRIRPVCVDDMVEISLFSGRFRMEWASNGVWRTADVVTGDDEREGSLTTTGVEIVVCMIASNMSMK